MHDKIKGSSFFLFFPTIGLLLSCSIEGPFGRQTVPITDTVRSRKRTMEEPWRSVTTCMKQDTTICKLLKYNLVCYFAPLVPFLLSTYLTQHISVAENKLFYKRGGDGLYKCFAFSVRLHVKIGFLGSLYKQKTKKAFIHYFFGLKVWI